MAICSCPVVTLVRVTIAPATTAPVGSTTAPRSAPVVADCAYKFAEGRIRATIKRPVFRSNLSRSLLINARRRQAQERVGLGAAGRRCDSGSVGVRALKDNCSRERGQPYPKRIISRNTERAGESGKGKGAAQKIIFESARSRTRTCRINSQETRICKVGPAIREVSRWRSAAKVRGRKKGRCRGGAGAYRRWPRHGSDRDTDRQPGWCTGSASG